MATIPKAVIFDSSGLVSLVKSDDQLHQRAVEVIEKITANGWNVLLPYEVLAESLNTIGKLVNKRSAIAVGEALMEQYTTQQIVFAQGQPHIVTDALKRMKSSTGAPSFVDCLVMAYADEYHTKLIFGFDATFKKNGYSLPA